jgi:hypothetical protein
LIQRRQQRQADARGSGSIDQRLAHGQPIFVRTARAVTVQIMKLADRCVAGLEHVCIQLRGYRVQAFRRHAAGQVVHGLAPGPEAVVIAGALLGQAGHRPLECMAVNVGHAGDGRAIDQPGGRDRVVGGNIDDVAVGIHRDHYVAMPAAGEPGAVEAIAGLHGHALEYKTAAR